MWYYAFENQQVGPVDEKAIRELIESKTIIASTLVWTKGMTTWQPLSTTALAGLLTPAAPALAAPAAAPAQPQTYASQYKTPEMEIKELEDLFMWYWICLIGTVFTFGLSGIASMVLSYIIIYRSWSLIQDGHARTTPGKAVGFLFIPFFNFYWIFECYLGLVRDSNAYVRRYQLPVVQQDEGLATAYCVLTLLCLVPYLNILAGLALFVIDIILTKNFKDMSIALIRARKK